MLVLPGRARARWRVGLAAAVPVALLGVAAAGGGPQAAPSPQREPQATPSPELKPPPPLELQPPLRIPPPLPAAPALLPPVAWPARAQQPPEPEQAPREGQPGKDVIWMPTPEALVERMLTMARVGPDDVVYDLGSGDGRLVIAAAARGARAVGVELDPGLVALSEGKARARGVADRARFVRADIFETEFEDATVVTLYLLPTLNLRLRPKLLALRPGTHVVSHAFGMDDWAPDEVSRAHSRTAYLWTVPAAVGGGWRVELEGGPAYDLTLTQRFQEIEGTVALDVVEASLREPVLRGDAIRFAFVDSQGAWHELHGTVAGDVITGTDRNDGGARGFRATRR